jgi:hypothetical protein
VSGINDVHLSKGTSEAIGWSKIKKEMPQAEGVTLLHLHPLVKREENAIIKFFLSLSLYSFYVGKCRKV